MDKTRVDYSKDKDKKNKYKRLYNTKQNKELEDFNRMIGQRYLSEDEKAEKIRKERGLNNI